MSLKSIDEMPKKNLMELAVEDYNELATYFQDSNSEVLSPEQKQILERWRAAYSLIRKYPSKWKAVEELRKLYPIGKAQAYADVMNAARFWNVYEKIDRDFLNTWFIDTLLQAISEAEDEGVKAKNLATLQKYLEKMPPDTIDPQLMEKNTFNIQIKMGDKSITLSEGELQRLPNSFLNKLVSNNAEEITDEEAEEIMNS